MANQNGKTEKKGECQMSVQVDKLMEIVRDAGLEVEEQAAFYKIAVGSRAVYIAKTKKVSRVNLAGFDFSHPAVQKITEKEARELKLGTVRAMIDFSKSEERVLEAFRTALGLIQHLAGAPANDSTPVAAKGAQKSRRRGVIQKTAETRGRAKTKKETETHA